MPGRKRRASSGANENIPWSIWSNLPNSGPIREWKPTPDQLQAGLDDDSLSITSGEQDAISKRIADTGNKDSYVYRSDRIYEEDAITQFNDEGEVVIDSYWEALQHAHTVTGKHSNVGARYGERFSTGSTTSNIATAQSVDRTSLAVIAKPTSTAFYPAKKKFKLTVRPKRSPELPQQALDALLNPQDQKDVPLETDGVKLGLTSLEISPPDHVDVFRSYALAKTIGLNARNCDADLLDKIYDAISAKEAQLYEDGYLDDYGRPVKKKRGKNSTQSAQSQAMLAWFHQAMFSIDRVVGRYTANRFVAAPPKPKRNREVFVMRKTFRLGPYRVLARKPAEVEKLEADVRKRAAEARRKKVQDS